MTIPDIESQGTLRSTQYGIRNTEYATRSTSTSSASAARACSPSARSSPRRPFAKASRSTSTRPKAWRSAAASSRRSSGWAATTAGAGHPGKGADLVVATEVSEALKAVRYVKPDGDFVLYAHVWAPTAVMLGKAPYPKLEEVAAAGARRLDDGNRFIAIPPEACRCYEGAPVADNIFTLGVMLARTRLGELLPPAEVEEVVRGRWKRGVERNLLAFQRGAGVCTRVPAGMLSDQEAVRLLASSFQLPAPELNHDPTSSLLPPQRRADRLGGRGQGRLRAAAADAARAAIATCLWSTRRRRARWACRATPAIAAIGRAGGSGGDRLARDARWPACWRIAAQAGVKAAVIISSGFSEMGNQAGEAEIKAIAARHGIRIVGPNCAGHHQHRHRLCPTMETLPPPGPRRADLAERRAGGRGAGLGRARRAGHLEVRLLRQPRRCQRG